MNKNFLYSILIHFALLFFLFAVFKFNNSENELDIVAVSLVSEGDSEKKSEQNAIDGEKKPEEKVINPEKEKAKIPEKEIKNPPAENKKTQEKNTIKKDEIKAPQAPQAPEAKEEKKNTQPDGDSIKITSKKVEAQKIENTIEQLNLSPREKFNIQNQLRRCYKKAILENKSSSVAINVKISVSQDGYIKSNLEEIIDKDLYNSAKGNDYKTAIDNARSAIRFCNPLRNLPADKFDSWKEITLQFDGKNN